TDREDAPADCYTRAGQEVPDGALRGVVSMRLVEYLDEQCVPFQSLLHPPAFTAQRLAKYLRIQGSRVARAVLLHSPDGYVLAGVPAPHRIALPRLASFWGGPMRLASQSEAARVFRDCEWGVVSPFGNLYGLPTLIDTSLGPDTWIVLEAGTHLEAVLLSCADFERRSGAVPLSLAARDPGGGRG